MAQLRSDTLCKYCLGCNKEENDNFIGTRNCKNFVPGYENWREMYQSELNKCLKNSKK